MKERLKVFIFKLGEKTADLSPLVQAQLQTLTGIMKPAAERPERLAEEFTGPPASTVLRKLGKSTFGRHLIKDIAASMRE
eukprot:14093236-Alexandrium_andersonii.AAC.1